jgi:hypothetical protein
MDNAYEYVIANGGIDTEEDYGYWAAWGVTFWGCNRRKEQDRTAVTIDAYEDIPQAGVLCEGERECGCEGWVGVASSL